MESVAIALGARRTCNTFKSVPVTRSRDGDRNEQDSFFFFYFAASFFFFDIFRSFMFKAVSRNSTFQLRSFSSAIPKGNKGRSYLAVSVLSAIGLGYLSWQYCSHKGPKALNPERYIPFDLVQKERISPDAYRLRISIKQEFAKSYPIPSCLYIKDDTIQVMRPYTPINPNPHKDGYIDFVVKRYENGSVSRTLSGFEPSVDQVHIRGPMKEEYEYKENSLAEIGMVLGLKSKFYEILDETNTKIDCWRYWYISHVSNHPSHFGKS